MVQIVTLPLHMVIMIETENNFGEFVTEKIYDEAHIKAVQEVMKFIC